MNKDLESGLKDDLHKISLGRKILNIGASALYTTSQLAILGAGVYAWAYINSNLEGMPLKNLGEAVYYGAIVPMTCIVGPLIPLGLNSTFVNSGDKKLENLDSTIIDYSI